MSSATHKRIETMFFFVTKTKNINSWIIHEQTLHRNLNVRFSAKLAHRNFLDLSGLFISLHSLNQVSSLRSVADLMNDSLLNINSCDCWCNSSNICGYIRPWLSLPWCLLVIKQATTVWIRIGIVLHCISRCYYYLGRPMMPSILLCFNRLCHKKSSL